MRVVVDNGENLIVEVPSQTPSSARVAIMVSSRVVAALTIVDGKVTDIATLGEDSCVPTKVIDRVVDEVAYWKARGDHSVGDSIWNRVFGDWPPHPFDVATAKAIARRKQWKQP